MDVASALDVRPKCRIAVGHDLFVVAGERAPGEGRHQVEDRIGRGDVPVVERFDDGRFGFREFPSSGSDQVAGSFPRPDNDAYKDTAIYLKISGEGSRRLRIPVTNPSGKFHAPFCHLTCGKIKPAL